MHNLGLTNDMISSHIEFIVILFVFSLYVLGVIIYVGMNLRMYFSKPISQEFDTKFIYLRFNQFKHLLALHLILTILLVIQCGGILLGFISLDFKLWMWRLIIFLQLVITLGSIYYTVSYRRWAMLWATNQKHRLPKFIKSRL